MDVYPYLVLLDFLVFCLLGGTVALMFVNYVKSHTHPRGALAKWFLGMFVCLCLFLITIELGNQLNALKPDRGFFIKLAPLFLAFLAMISVSWWMLRNKENEAGS